MSDDHDAWLASLAGRGENGDKECRMLRQIMLNAEQRQGSEENLEHDWQRLRFALRREARTERSTGWRWPLLAQAAMLILVVGAVTFMALPEHSRGPIQDDGAVMRGRFTQEIAVAEPAAAAEKLAERLRVLGVAVELKHQPELSELRVRLEYPVATAVKSLFTEEQIELPKQGDIYLLFVPAVR